MLSGVPTTVQEFGYKGGTFAEPDIRRARQMNVPLTMDCALPGICLNNCTYCGFCGVNRDRKLERMEIQRVFREFADLGGKSIKILGEGEPLLRPDILDLLRLVQSLGMTPVLFTCGDVLGSDELAQRFQGMTGEQVAVELESAGTTVVLKYEKRNQDDIVRRSGYTELRNRALIHLLDLGFNSYSPTRLGFAIVVQKDNLGEIPRIFGFALSKNVYPLVCPLMPIGKMAVRSERDIYCPPRGEIHALTQQLVQLRKRCHLGGDEESDFPGGLPCDISRAGMYMDDVGTVKVCEADDPVGSVRESSLAVLWRACSAAKDRKYEDNRWQGLCRPKRKAGIVCDY